MSTAAFRIILFLTVAAVSGNAAAANTVIGTVELTVDGEDQTWYVLQPDGGAMPTASWVALGPDHAAAAIAAYETRDIALVTDEATGAPVPEGNEAVLMISFSFDIGDTSKTHSLPVDTGSGPVSLMFLSNWRDLTTMYNMNDGPGEMNITTIDARQDGPSRFAGTIEGTLRNRDNETMTVNAGRFEVDGAVYISR